MRHPRIYTEQLLQLNQTVTLESNAAHHLYTVLRLKTGCHIRLFNGQPQEYTGKIIYINHHSATIELTAIPYIEPDPILDLHLILGLSKGERMDIALQKATELGVTRISPLLAAHSVIKLEATRRVSRYQHWQQIIIAACEQSGRCRIPKLDAPQIFTVCLEESVHNDRRLMLHPLGTATLNTIAPPTSGISLLIGPEGGFTELELQQAQSNGFILLHLGPRILRAETAPLAAIAAIQTIWGDFNQPLNLI